MWDDVDLDQAEIRIESSPATATRPPSVAKNKEARRVSIPKHCPDLLVDLKAYNELTDRTPCVVLDEQ
jgi:hypothetical protein